MTERLTPLGDGSTVIDEARSLLSGAAQQDRARFEDRLAKGLRAYPVREDNAYLTVCAPFALFRMAGLDLGRRLVERNQLDAVEEVFRLHVDEARSAVLEGAPVRTLVQRRGEDRTRALANPGPARFGPKPGPPPLVHRLPAPGRKATEDMLWLIEHVVPASDPADRADATVITGIAAARGIAQGNGADHQRRVPVRQATGR